MSWQPVPCVRRRWLCLLMLLAPVADAKVYRWVDADGNVHYGDAIPSGVQAERLRNVPDGDPENFAELQVLREGEQAVVRVGNRLKGPIQVALQLVADSNVAAEPAMPLSRVLAAGETREVSIVRAIEPNRTSEFEVRMQAVPGDPAATPQDVVYSLPVDETRWQLGQGFHGSFSHSDDQNRYAIDLVVAEGTPVLCARAGTVMQIESGFTEAGTNRKRLATRANLIRILHSDGSMAVYAHLREDGALVRPGEHVAAGQLIGYAGNTGFSSGPHLHFVVQANTGMRLKSLPFRMIGPQGYLPLESKPQPPRTPANAAQGTR